MGRERAEPEGERVRRVARVRGRVQGVGFRPFVARLARGSGLAGAVRNDAGRVVVEVEGPPAALARFAEALRAPPPPARVDAIAWEDAALRGGAGFRIEGSAPGAALGVPLPPDLAPCAACRAELEDPGARRYGYPFLACTACGPRFTVATALPHDRARTTLSAFPLCAACRAEYDDPADRRHHAQTMACAACGPRLRLLDAEGAPLAERGEALARAVAALKAGALVALKGLGGFQLLCDATDAAAVARLRARKRRPAQPLAVLVRDLEAARALAHLSSLEAATLADAAAPILLCRRRGEPLAPNVAPGLRDLGLMLPPSPLHLLLAAALPPLVCTSANVHGEPMPVDDEDALARLGPIADLFLTHDRPIARRADDAVVRVVDGAARTLRVGRGVAPVALPFASSRPRLAVGAHLESAPAFALARELLLWPRVGDLDGRRAREAHAEAVADLRAFLGAEPVELVCDLHPDYASTRLAEALAAELGAPLRRVAHHAAHVGAALAEHGVHAERQLAAFAWDGFGRGPEGELAGGEGFLWRGGQLTPGPGLRPWPLPGALAAARDGRRCAAGMLAAAGVDAAPEPIARFLPLARSPRLAPPTSSVGRLFDAVAALLGICAESSYQAQAAMELEALAEPGAEPYAFALEGGRIDWRPMVRPLLGDRDAPARAASRFHATLAHALVRVAGESGVGVVALGGGCFQNALLAQEVARLGRAAGMDVLLPREVPPNDGGLAVGQLWCAERRAAGGREDAE
ncbi:MAG TPA: carbamoyltransferase HypF [Polyangiaceae bacterium LLY-WYZ-15_(1-7)]|nr:carbamoyltransferase HypF [Sandaracinus sp.]HJL05370.1 carbamoyltransferase HypF [Polyangiaceae bacterium LLY-WYZ-15_(1-7)]HJL07255.1 carbamoyltransferase HypF [Polyangiaceae bacterium LLY-WYZ-15_(1-7)]